MTTALTKDSPDRTSSKEIRLCPSRRSSYRSFTCFRTFKRCWFIHFVKVFFCTLSLSSAILSTARSAGSSTDPP
uniref:Uncharacterized protein n=1 Tax=Anguilla anguilla TaxID=7936 RepID=A0A0E9RQR3_ANGAN